jgi:hypothetical protein
MRDLFTDRPADPRAVEQARRERVEREEVERAKAAAERKLATYYRRLSIAVDVLGARLARNPEDDALSELFHTACDWRHTAEGAFTHGL